MVSAPGCSNFRSRLVAGPICKANFGRAPADTFTYEELAASIHPDDFQRWQETVQKALRERGDLHVEYRAIWPDGTIHWIEIRAQTRFDAHGNPMLMSGVSIDTSDAKEAEEYRTLMTQEMSHRIKNILATVQSVVTQSLRLDDVPDSTRQSVVARINALGRSQDILTGKRWDVAGIRDTVERAIEPFNQSNRIHFFGPDVQINQGASGALMMALHELATNAVKYGALSAEQGRVRIEWSREGRDLVFRWTEGGGPPVQQPQRSGFGSRMIDRALSSTIRGEATIDYRAEGVAFTMRAPMENFA